MRSQPNDPDILRMNRFDGRTAVVTGGGSGVGLAIAVALAKEGANLCLIGRRLEKLEAAASEAQSSGARVVCCRADLAKDADLMELMRRLSVDADGIDILVHSAAVLQRAPIESASLDEFDTHYRVNVRAPYALTQVLLPALRSRRGEVVFINSSSGIMAKPQFAQYDSTKHALKALADSLRAEVNSDGVRVLSVYLGRTATEMQARIHEKEHKAYRPELLLQPGDIASIVLSALSLPRTAELTDIHIRPLIKT
jgi:NADP-dependent 3-hydroxy acid dehydrogenase YdfG